MLLFIHYIAWVVLALALHQLRSVSTESLYIKFWVSHFLWKVLRQLLCISISYLSSMVLKRSVYAIFIKKNQWLIGVNPCEQKLLRLLLYMETFETVPYLWRSLCESANRCWEVPHGVTEVLQVTLLGVVCDSSHRVTKQLNNRERGEWVNPEIN